MKKEEGRMSKVVVHRSVAVLDGVELVVNDVTGVQAQTEPVVWRAIQSVNRRNINNKNTVVHSVGSCRICFLYQS